MVLKELEELAVKQNLKKVDNFVVLGDIEISDVEKKFLSIHYKCKTRKYRTDNDIKIKVNKIGVKNR